MLGQPLVKARQAVVADLLPGRRIGDELVSRRAHAGVSVDGSHPDDQNLSARRVTSEQVGSAGEQKVFASPPGGVQSRRDSSPLMTVRDPG